MKIGGKRREREGTEKGMEKGEREKRREEKKGRDGGRRDRQKGGMNRGCVIKHSASLLSYSAILVLNCLSTSHDSLATN